MLIDGLETLEYSDLRKKHWKTLLKPCDLWIRYRVTSRDLWATSFQEISRSTSVFYFESSEKNSAAKPEPKVKEK